jgi:fumarate reductase subunit D
VARRHGASYLGCTARLPLHFLVLGLAIEGAAQLDGFLQWTHSPLVRIAETVLVALLAVHLLGGMRLLVIENLPWRPQQKWLAALAMAGAGAIAVAFFVLAIA